MLKISKFDINNNYRTLNLNDEIFHKALKNVLRGEKRFHVINPYGENFDLVYRNNTELFKRDKNNPHNDLVNKKDFYPPYLTYDEYDISKLYLKIFDSFNYILFKTIDEYSVVIARILLTMTSKKVCFTDERIRWFLGEHDNLIIGNGTPINDDRTMKVTDYLEFDACLSKFDTIWSVTLFHNIFFLQWLTDYPTEKIKYVEVSIEKTEGIGSLLANIIKMEALFKQFGWKTIITPKSSRYKDEMLSKYFNLALDNSGATDENTIYITAFFSMAFTYPVLSQKLVLNSQILNPEFLKELDEYADAVIGNKRMLGVLIRGTDYIISDFPVQPLPIDKTIQMIRERLDKYKYDGFFLATEDLDYFNALKKAFPKKMRSIAQERHSVREFSSAKFITDLEKEKRSGAAYDALIEDTTANYFYAVYMLSLCESFFTTPGCNGVEMVRSFNENRFLIDESYGMIGDNLTKIH